MEIRRKFEMLATTNRRYVIRQSPVCEQIACAECGEPMLTAEQSAGFFGVKQRRIFKIIETDAAHFTETEAGALMICITSLAEFLDDEQTLTPAKSSPVRNGDATETLSSLLWKLTNKKTRRK